MNKISLTLFILVMSVMAFSQANLRLTKIDPLTHEVTITNLGTASQNAATWNLCRFPDYDPLNTLVIISGSTNIAVGASLTVIFPFIKGTDGECGLYINSANFGSAANMKDYMEWGSAGHTRESVAVTAGVWTVGTFVAGDPAYNYIGSGTDQGFQFWSSQINGCTYSTADNYNPAATIDDGSCLYNGCTDPLAPNFDSHANQDDDSCISGVGTCQEAMACNYDPSGDYSDCNLCEYASCAGCTYACADNYNPTATIDDGSCVGCDGGCQGDMDGNGVINTSDLLVFMAMFGQICP